MVILLFANIFIFRSWVFVHIIYPTILSEAMILSTVYLHTTYNFLFPDFFVRSLLQAYYQFSATLFFFLFVFIHPQVRSRPFFLSICLVFSGSPQSTLI